MNTPLKIEDIQTNDIVAATIEERAIAAFNAINEREYKCALAESQVSKQLYEQVKKEYSIAQNAFVQGVMYQRKIDIEKACEVYREELSRMMSTFGHIEIGMFDVYELADMVSLEGSVKDFRKAMEE